MKTVFWFNCVFLEAALPILVQSSLYVVGVRRKTGMGIHRELINKKMYKKYSDRAFIATHLQSV